MYFLTGAPGGRVQLTRMEVAVPVARTCLGAATEEAPTAVAVKVSATNEETAPSMSTLRRTLIRLIVWQLLIRFQASYARVEIF
jgi:hypothetical protein